MYENSAGSSGAIYRFMKSSNAEARRFSGQGTGRSIHGILSRYTVERALPRGTRAAINGSKNKTAADAHAELRALQGDNPSRTVQNQAAKVISKVQPDSTDAFCITVEDYLPGPKQVKIKMDDMTAWYLVQIRFGRYRNISARPYAPSISSKYVTGIRLLNKGENPKLTYFVAPNIYLGDRRAEYGGYLNYSIYFTSNEQLMRKGITVIDADVIIGGNNRFVVYDNIIQPPSGVNWRYRVKISEDGFTNLDGTAVTKDQFKDILANVTSIYIRATYRMGITTTRLMNVSFESDDETETSNKEDRQPSKDDGLSCEQGGAAGHFDGNSAPNADNLPVPFQGDIVNFGTADNESINDDASLEYIYYTMTIVYYPEDNEEPPVQIPQHLKSSL